MRTISTLIILGLIVLLGFEIWQWLFTRVYVAPGHSLLLQSYSGQASVKDQYARDGQQGMIEEMLGPGRHFINPFLYSTRDVADVEVPAGQIALLSNKVGKDLPPDRFLAGPAEKGTQRMVLTPGVWRINPFGQEVFVQKSAGGQKTQPQVTIRPGFVGVQTLREGPGKGILPDVLQPGIYNINPEEVQVDEYEVGYDILEIHTVLQPTDVKDEDGTVHKEMLPAKGTGVAFPLADGKEMHLDLTVVYGIYPDEAPYCLGHYGTWDDVKEKVVKPQVLSVCKNEGSNLTTLQFIEGQSREDYQARVIEALQKAGTAKKIHFRIALVRGFYPDAQITRTIQAKRIAEEERITLLEEQNRDAVSARLEQAKRQVDVALTDFDRETEKLTESERASGTKRAAEIEAQGQRQQAGLLRQSADITAQTTLIAGGAKAKVAELRSKAEASKYELLVKAYGSAEAYNLATFAEKLRPELRVEFRYAGPGTFWTDMTQGVTDMAARKILSDGAQGEPAPKK